MGVPRCCTHTPLETVENVQQISSPKLTATREDLEMPPPHSPGTVAFLYSAGFPLAAFPFKSRYQDEVCQLQTDKESMEQNLSRLQDEKKAMEMEMSRLQDENKAMEKEIGRLNVQKRNLATEANDQNMFRIAACGRAQEEIKHIRGIVRAVTAGCPRCWAGYLKQMER